MKLGIINGWTEDCFKYVQDKGLEAVEFCVNHNYDSKEFLDKATEIKGYSEKYNVAVGSIGRWGMKRVDENGEIIPEALQADYNVIDAASIIGCPVYNCGCNAVEGKTFPENCRIAVNYLSKVIEYAKAKGVKVAVYNCDWENFIVTPEAWNVVLNELPDLGIKYDPSHCVSRSGDYLKEMMDWGHRIYHFHLKGTLYINGIHYDDPPAGLDMIDWRPVMALLYIKGYDGMVSIEPHSSVWQGDLGQWGVDFTIKFIRPFIRNTDNTSGEASPYMP